MNYDRSDTFWRKLHSGGAMAIELNHKIEARLTTLAEAHHTSPEAILGEAAEQYLEREEKPQQADHNLHPSGNPWPHRSPVGGIITPS